VTPEAHTVHAAVPLARPAEQAIWSKTGYEEPVFLDRSGRRTPAVRAAGVLAAICSAAWLAALVTGAMGFARLPAQGIVNAAAVTSAPRGLVAEADRQRRVLLVDRDVRMVTRRHRLEIRTS
jgi:hypothetical protein